MTFRTNHALHNELASNGSKSKIFIDRTFGTLAVGGRPVEVAGPKADILCHGAGTRMPPSTLIKAVDCFPIVVLHFSPSTVEKTDVRRCRKNGSPQAVA